ncbi:MAG: transcriptional repressor [Burkholderiales bacterium]|nr:transcriptional repressor [Burkholderiales bacterium]
MKKLPFSRNDARELLRRNGINPTHQRIEIAHALYSRCEHMSADQVMAIVNERHPETSKATVYNTLNLFAEKKLVREVVIDPSKLFYDPNMSDHHHLFDVTTGQITDIDAANISVAGLPALPDGMIAEGVDIVVRVRPQAA